MWSPWILGILSIVVAGVIWWLDPEWRAMRQFKKELAHRQPVRDDELSTRYFAADDITADIPIRVRRLFAKHSDYPVEMLFPDDDLGFVWYELDMTFFFEDIEREFGVQFNDQDIGSVPICSIREISILIARKANSQT